LLVDVTGGSLTPLDRIPGLFSRLLFSGSLRTGKDDGENFGSRSRREALKAGLDVGYGGRQKPEFTPLAFTLMHHPIAE
jgi:hypothetical protein